MEKLEKKHHDHKFTEWLKNIIFGLVMLAPMLAIAVRCGYVMWNKNAYLSYDGSQLVTATRNVSNTGTIDENIVYTFTYDSDLGNTGMSSTEIWYSEISIDWTDYGAPSDKTFVRFFTHKYGNASYVYLGTETQSQAYIFWNGFGTNQLPSTFSFKSSRSLTLNGNQAWFLSFNTYIEEKLDNAFSYSVSQLSNEPIFNWTRNTGIYQPINAMVSGLEIENDTLQIMLAYWSLMTAVYIVFDLIIFCFTKLTHFING